MIDCIDPVLEIARMEKGKKLISPDGQIDGESKGVIESDRRKDHQSELISEYFQQNKMLITDLCKELRRNGISSESVAEVLGLPEALLPDLEHE